MIKSISLFLILVCLGIAIPLYFNDLLLYVTTNTGVGWVSTTILIRLFVIVIFIFAFKFLFSAFEVIRRTKIWLICTIGTAIGFLIAFAIAPIYQIDYGLLNDGVKLENIKNLDAATDGTFSNNSTVAVIAFFTTTCPFCKSACQKLSQNLAAGQTLKVDLFFPGNRKDTDLFLENNNGTLFDSHLISDEDTFMKYAGYNFPSIFVINTQGETTYHWVGDEMNYSALDYLLSLEQ